MPSYVDGFKFDCGRRRVCDQAKAILLCNENRLTLQIITSVSVLTCVCLLIVGVESFVALDQTL